VESGIPPFRGEGGLWNTYDPNTLGLEYFQANPERAWPILKEIFYEHFEKAKPNRAHEVLAAWETRGWPRARGAVTAGSPNRGGALTAESPDPKGAPTPGSTGRARLRVLITQNVDSVQLN
jgi:NAD-dependent SIR2 family protein deacetylase